MSRGEGIKKLNTLFEVYKKRLTAPQGTVIKTFQEVVWDLFHFNLPKEKCSYSVTTKTLTIIDNGPLKSEILLKKPEILAHLKGRLGEKGAPKNII